MADSNEQKPKEGIAGAYQRKEYGWFAFYIIFVVIAARFGGAIGAGISVLVIAGLYKILKSKSYSLTKKVLLSVACLVGGVAAMFLAAYLLVGGIAFFGGQRAADSLNPEFQEAQSRTLTDEQFVSSSTPETKPQASMPSAPTVNPNLESKSYVDQKYKFSINAPKGWLVDTSGTNATVQFDIPAQDEVALMTVTAESSTGYDLQTYAKNVIQGFFSSEGGQNANLKIIAQGNTTLAGEPAYKFETTSDFINGSDVYPFHGLYVVSMRSNMAYVLFVSSFEQNWTKHRDTFLASIESFQFPK